MNKKNKDYYNDYVSVNTRILTRELRTRFKHLCIEEGVSMQEAVKMLIEKAVRKKTIEGL